MENPIKLNILAKAKTFLSEAQMNQLHIILDEEFTDKPKEITDLVVVTNIHNYIKLFLVAKKVQGLADSSLRAYYLELNCFARFIYKNVENIEANDIRKYIASAMQRNLKDTSIANQVAVLRSFFTWLQNEGCLIKNPMQNISKIKVGKHLRSPLSQKEVEIIRESCTTLREKAIFEVFYATGIRVSELIKINQSDINWQTLSLKVCGKGDKDRIVYLNHKTEVILQKYLHSRDDNNCALFVSDRKPHNRLGKRAIEKIVSKIGCQSEIDKRVFCHLVRHTNASHLINSGMRIEEISKLLGHERISTTQLYTQLNDETIRQSYRQHIS